MLDDSLPITVAGGEKYGQHAALAVSTLHCTQHTIETRMKSLADGVSLITMTMEWT